MAKKTRMIQYREFMHMRMLLFGYAIHCGIIIKTTASWRSPELAAKYARLGTGIRNSKHCKSLAEDYYVLKGSGKAVYFGQKKKDGYYKYLKLGVFWESIGGKWLGRKKMKNGDYDVYHFEHPEAPA